MRPPLAVLLGLGTAAGCAVVLGDYPLSGSVPWLAALVIPLLIGVVMTLVAGGHRSGLWILTGPLALGAMAWGVRIATGWGLDPVPASCWAAMVISLVWPLGWALGPARRASRDAAAARDAGPGRPAESVDG